MRNVPENRTSVVGLEQSNTLKPPICLYNVKRGFPNRKCNVFLLQYAVYNMNINAMHI
jgi:hypothetical protein